MADCYAPEADDLHRRWLPREIFDDIGIADPDDAAAGDDPPPPEAAAAAVEELAVQLAGLLGGGKGVVSPLAPPPPPTATAVPAPCNRSQVCGLEGSVVVAAAYGGSNGAVGGAGAAAMTWPFVPNSLVQWQVPSNFVNMGGALDYYLGPPPLCRFSPPAGPGARLRGGTGVFLPRADAYRQHSVRPPVKDGKAPNPRAWPGRQQQPPTQREEDEAGMALQRQKETQQRPDATAAAAVHHCPPSEVAVVLPQDWSYHC